MRVYTVPTFLISGEQATSGVCDNVQKHTAEYYGGVQCVGSVAASGSSAINHGDDDDHPEGY